MASSKKNSSASSPQLSDHQQLQLQLLDQQHHEREAAANGESSEHGAVGWQHHAAGDDSSRQLSRNERESYWRQHAYEASLAEYEYEVSTGGVEENHHHGGGGGYPAVFDDPTTRGLFAMPHEVARATACVDWRAHPALAGQNGWLVDAMSESAGTSIHFPSRGAHVRPARNGSIVPSSDVCIIGKLLFINSSDVMEN